MGAGYNIPVSVSTSEATPSSASFSGSTIVNFNSPNSGLNGGNSLNQPNTPTTANSAAANGPIGGIPGGGQPAYTASPALAGIGNNTGLLLMGAAVVLWFILKRRKASA